VAALGPIPKTDDLTLARCTFALRPEDGDERDESTGDLSADWEAAYRENLDWVYRFVYGRVGNRADAEDVTAEVFMRALRRLRLGAPPAQLRAYLSTTARSVLTDHWRKAYALREASYDACELAEPSIPVDAGADENVLRANRLLALLPDQYRRILELRFLHGRSIRDAAAELGISIGNAKVLQHRALRRAAEIGSEDLE
jgi:RNA polymerase sigma-70 factor, ECF subfamily